MKDLKTDFSLVWERVTGEPTEERLPALIEEENTVFLTLAALAHGMREMWEERDRSEKRLRTLQAEQFLLTGDTHPLPSAPPCRKPTLTALRELYYSATALHRQYAEAGREAFAAEADSLAERAKKLLFLRGFGVRG